MRGVRAERGGSEGGESEGDGGSEGGEGEKVGGGCERGEKERVRKATAKASQGSWQERGGGLPPPHTAWTSQGETLRPTTRPPRWTPPPEVYRAFALKLPFVYLPPPHHFKRLDPLEQDLGSRILNSS